MSLSVPIMRPELATALMATAPVFPNRCACGEEVAGERLREAWHFYCQRCGRDWSAPATRLREKPKPRKLVKRCACARTCRFCGGAR